MILKVEHSTLFEYEEPIYETATEVRLHPASAVGSQQCASFNLQITPPAAIFDYTDYYGNRVHHFNILQSHKRVQIIATSVVETAAQPETGQFTEDEILLLDLLAESHYVRFDPAIQALAARFREIGEPCRQATEICRHINDTFLYEPGATDVHSTSAVVMALGRGVCQDFAHIMLAACRHLGLPARYVSGYLYGGGSTPEGQDEASHAWCEVWCGTETGWTGFDPTHKTLFVDDRYIKIGTGRDYGDVPPVRGTYKGTSAEKLGVSVRVSSLEHDSDALGLQQRNRF
ncbi:transglutaminase family protein [Chlorobaculum sp. 24CR]|uniref:transglutaminase family protein n=1 Tax=Chlorobaculum sp. 24CR TaxID=2508878 RepID=UPI00100A9FEA|nr:transglutaminase family protein [Chlorobaculum sp. 24CR]RXK81621.1 transglutaminase family protein [Chlorobaculum sp. 24CR]